MPYSSPEDFQELTGLGFEERVEITRAYFDKQIDAEREGEPLLIDPERADEFQRRIFEHTQLSEGFLELWDYAANFRGAFILIVAKPELAKSVEAVWKFFKFVRGNGKWWFDGIAEANDEIWYYVDVLYQFCVAAELVVRDEPVVGTPSDGEHQDMEEEDVMMEEVECQETKDE